MKIYLYQHKKWSETVYPYLMTFKNVKSVEVRHIFTPKPNLSIPRILNMHFSDFNDILYLNPRLPKVFSVTHLPKGGGNHPLWTWDWHAQSISVWYHPLWTWDWHAQSISVWYHSIGEGLPFPLMRKFWKSANVWRHNDVFKHDRPEKADFHGNKGQNWIFAKIVQNIGISPGVFLIKEGNGVSNMFCKFRVNTMKIFFKMAT